MLVNDLLKVGVYKIKLEQNGSTFDMEINNVISWDVVTINMTEEELRSLIEYVTTKLNTMQSRRDY